MDIEHTKYVSELLAILACDQSDSYLKKWAEDQLQKIEHQAKLSADLEKTPVPVA
ncbi:MAG: hypothetical protein ACYDHZ_11440 [Dehalococcoidia bacterium]